MTLPPLPRLDRVEPPDTVRPSQPLHLVRAVLGGRDHVEQLLHRGVGFLVFPFSDPVEEGALPLLTGGAFAFPHPPLRLLEFALLGDRGGLVSASDRVERVPPRPSALPRRLLVERSDGHGRGGVLRVRQVKSVYLVAVGVVDPEPTAPVTAEGIDGVLCGVVGLVHRRLEGVAFPTPHPLRDELHLGRVACRTDDPVGVPQLGPGDARQDAPCAHVGEREEVRFVVPVDGDDGVARLSYHDRRARERGLLRRVRLGVDAVSFVGRYVARRRGRVVRHLFGDDPDRGGLVGVFLLGRQVVVGEFAQEEFAEERVERFLESFLDGAAHVVLPLEGGEV